MPDINWSVIAQICAPTLAVIIGAWLANRNARSAAEQLRQAQAKLDRAAAETQQKLDQIARDTNGNLEAAVSAVRALEKQLRDAGITPEHNA